MERVSDDVDSGNHMKVLPTRIGIQQKWSMLMAKWSHGSPWRNAWILCAVFLHCVKLVLCRSVVSCDHCWRLGLSTTVLRRIWLHCRET